jgi:hypothetical protein
VIESNRFIEEGVNRRSFRLSLAWTQFQLSERARAAIAIAETRLSEFRVVPGAGSRLVTGTFFFVLVRLLREGRTPDLFLRLQALGPDLPLHGALVRNDPGDSELCLLVAVANFDLVADLHLAPATPEFYTMVADI